MKRSESHSNKLGTCSYLANLRRFLETRFKSKKDLIISFHETAMPKARCICKKDVLNWLPSQRFFLAQLLKRLP